jgi:acetyl-CoA synthetase
VFRQIIQKTKLDVEDVPSLRHCMSAGEHLSDEVLNAWKKRFKQDIYEAIGMSECSYYISQSRRAGIRPGSAGRPQPGHQVELLADNMTPVGVNEEGMLCIPTDDPGLFIEYWGLKDETESSRKAGYFLTGDYARRDQDGYIWFVGRRDDIINSFGYRVSPHEVERVLKNHAAVADCVAVEESVGKNKAIVSACIIPTEAHSQSLLLEEELLKYGNQHLASYKAPRKIHFVESFPRTKNGKVLRKAVTNLISESG